MKGAQAFLSQSSSVAREVIAHLLQDAGVVGVEPVQLIAGQQPGFDQAPLDGTERQGFKPQHGAFAARDVLRLVDEQQVLDADAEVALLVVAGLVGKDHAGFKRACGPPW